MISFMAPSTDGVFHSRGMFLIGGVLSLLVGVFAVAAPQIFSFVLTQLIAPRRRATGRVV